ncbi:carbonic anhydrase 14-like [Tachysurus ichikawai]
MTEDKDAAVDLCTEASGLLCQIRRHHFETGEFLVQVVGAAMESLKNIRKDEYWAELSEAAAGDDSHLPMRRRTMRKHLGQSVVLSTVGHTDFDNPSLNPYQSLKRSLLKILDRAILEMETFTEEC